MNRRNFFMRQGDVRSPDLPLSDAGVGRSYCPEAMVFERSRVAPDFIEFFSKLLKSRRYNGAIRNLMVAAR